MQLYKGYAMIHIVLILLVILLFITGLMMYYISHILKRLDEVDTKCSNIRMFLILHQKQDKT